MEVTSQGCDEEALKYPGLLGLGYRGCHFIGEFHKSGVRLFAYWLG